MEIEKQIEFLEKVDEYFKRQDDLLKEEMGQVHNRDLEQEDYLHELELSRINAVEILKVAKRLIFTRRERRKNKNNVLTLNTIKPLTDTYYKKGISAEIKQTIENLKTLKKNQENAKYNVRIAEGLKVGEPNAKV